MEEKIPLLSSPCAPPLPNISQQCGRLLVGCCFIPSSRSHQIRGPIALSIFFFYPSSRCLKQRVNILPHAFSPSVSPIHPPLPPTPSFGWLLHLPIEQQPSKTGALTSIRLMGSRGAAIRVHGGCRHGCPRGAQKKTQRDQGSHGGGGSHDDSDGG